MDKDKGFFSKLVFEYYASKPDYLNVRKIDKVSSTCHIYVDDNWKEVPEKEVLDSLVKQFINISKAMLITIHQKTKNTSESAMTLTNMMYSVNEYVKNNDEYVKYYNNQMRDILFELTKAKHPELIIS